MLLLLLLVLLLLLKLDQKQLHIIHRAQKGCHCEVGQSVLPGKM